MNNAAKTQIETATKLGKAAFERGTGRVPAFDPAINEMIKGRVGFRPPAGEAPSTAIFKAWMKGWDRANLAA